MPDRSLQPKRWFVYFLSAEGTTFTKIGKTGRLRERMDEIQSCCPSLVLLDACAETFGESTAHFLEGVYHSTFRRERQQRSWDGRRSEWFWNGGSFVRGTFLDVAETIATETPRAVWRWWRWAGLEEATQVFDATGNPYVGKWGVDGRDANHPQPIYVGANEASESFSLTG